MTDLTEAKRLVEAADPIHGNTKAAFELAGWLRDSDLIAAHEAALRENEALREVLGGMIQRHASAIQNWTQAVVDAQRSGNRDLSVSIQNTALTALDGFPVEIARALLGDRS